MSSDEEPIPQGRPDEDLLAIVHRRADSIRLRRRIGGASALLVVLALVATPVFVQSDEPTTDRVANEPSSDLDSVRLTPGTPRTPTTDAAGESYPAVIEPRLCGHASSRSTSESVVDLPDVIGLSEDAARTRLKDLGVRVWVRPGAGREAGEVVDQDPAPGAVEVDGCWVALTVGSDAGAPRATSRS